MKSAGVEHTKWCDSHASSGHIDIACLLTKACNLIVSGFNTHALMSAVLTYMCTAVGTAMLHSSPVVSAAK